MTTLFDVISTHAFLFQLLILSGRILIYFYYPVSKNYSSLEYVKKNWIIDNLSSESDTNNI